MLFCIVFISRGNVFLQPRGQHAEELANGKVDYSGEREESALRDVP